MVKIAYVLRKFPVLSETFILNEILELEAQGHDVHIFSIERPNDPCYHQNLSKLKAQITYMPSLKKLWRHRIRASEKFGKRYTQAFLYALFHPKPSLFLRFLQGCFIANESKKKGIEHFHAHFATRATSVVFFTSKLTAVPYSFTAHAVDIFKESLCRKALQKKMERAKFVVTVSDYNKRFLAEVDNTSSGKVHKVLNGIDMSRFFPGSPEDEAPFTFLCVARFVEKKGHMVLLEACRILKEEKIPFRCLLIGKGKLQKQIEQGIKENRLEEEVVICGPRPQEKVLEEYRKSHAFILPCITGKDGNRDGLPVSIVEALASGIPVVTTPMTGNPEVIQNRYNGLMIPFEDPAAAADAMRELIRNRSLYDNLKKNARPSVEKVFDIRVTTRQLGRLFEECPN